MEKLARQRRQRRLHAHHKRIRSMPDHPHMKEDKLLLAKGQAYSMENRAAHEAADRRVEYIGYLLQGNRIYDYYEDEEGDFWFENRMYLPNGTAVSEEEYIFGRRTRKTGE